MVHRQGECHGAVAARGVGHEIGGLGGSGIGCAVPLKLVAGCHCHRSSIAAVDYQVEGDDTVATRGRKEFVRRGGSRCSVGNAILPGEAVADHLIVGEVVDGVHAQAEGDDRVAPHHGVQRIDVCILHGQGAAAEGVAVASADDTRECCRDREVFLYLVQHKTLFEGEPSDVGGAHSDSVLAAAVAVVEASGDKTAIGNGKHTVVSVTVALDQFVRERQGDVVVNRGEATDDGCRLSVFAEAGGRQQDIGRCRVVVNHRIGHSLEFLAVAYMVYRHRGEAVEDAVNKRETQTAVGRNRSEVLVVAFVL